MLEHGTSPTGNVSQPPCSLVMDPVRVEDVHLSDAIFTMAYSRAKCNCNAST